MSQFVMVRAVEEIQCPEGMRLCKVDASDEFLALVAREYFGTAEECRVVVDQNGAAESFMNAAWDAQRTGGKIEDCEFARFAHVLIEAGVDFVCWAGDDFRGLPVVRTWPEFVGQLLAQTAQQPADCWVQFQPATSPGLSRSFRRRESKP
jgi:hypothetical protein